jgi:hypothetical protein
VPSANVTAMIALIVLLRMPFKGYFTNSFHQTWLWRSEHQHGVSRSLTKKEETLFSVEGRDENRPHAFSLSRVLISKLSRQPGFGCRAFVWLGILSDTIHILTLVL